MGQRVLVYNSDGIWYRGTVNAQVGGGETFGARKWQVLFDDLTTTQIADGEQRGILYTGEDVFYSRVQEYSCARTTQPRETLLDSIIPHSTICLNCVSLACGAPPGGSVVYLSPVTVSTKKPNPSGLTPDLMEFYKKHANGNMLLEARAGYA